LGLARIRGRRWNSFALPGPKRGHGAVGGIPARHISTGCTPPARTTRSPARRAPATALIAVRVGIRGRTAQAETSQIRVSRQLEEQDVIKGLSSYFGSWVPLEEYNEPEPINMQILLDDGFERISVSSLNSVQQALRAAEQALRRWGGDPAEIDGLLFYTDDLNDTGAASQSADFEYHANRAELLHGILDLGVTHAYPQALWLAGCSNAVIAAVHAQNMVDTGQARCVLVLGGDRPPAGETRINGGASTPLGIRSDSGIAFVVDNDPRSPGMRIDTFATAAALDCVGKYEVGDTGGYLLSMAAALKKLAANFDARSDLAAAAFPAITGANYSLPPSLMYLMGCGLKRDRFALPTKREHAHSVSGDVLMNAERLLQRDERVLAISPAAFGWVLVSFSRESCLP
jgi:hypothetical protein